MKRTRWLSEIVNCLFALVILAGLGYAAEIPNTSVFSQTDANNNTGTVPTWAEGQAPSQVNDSARALQGAITREWNWSHPTITSGGAADVQTLTYTVAPAALYDGMRHCFEAGFTNTGSATLNVNGLGARTIQKIVTGTLTNLAANDIRAGDRPCVTYRATGTVYVLETPTSATPYSAGGTDVALADGGTGASLADPNKDQPLSWNDTAGAVQFRYQLESFCVAASDETTLLTTGTAKVTFRMPYAFTVASIRGSLSTVATGATLMTFDVNETGVSILSTTATFDASESTTTSAATPLVISDTAIADDAQMTIDIDAIGNTTAGKGLKVCLIGRQT